MSDVIVSTTESTTDVTTTNDVTTVAITNTVVEISQATAGVQGPPGANSDPTYVFVTNKTGAQLNKGSIVYVSGANGTHTQVSLALATGDVTSARTLGWLAEDIANNATGLCCVEGYLDGIDTQGVTEGAQLYLSPTTPGAFTETKPSAPDHMVYVGFCSKASAGNGRVFVFVQNGAELEELHDVKIVSPQNNDLLRYVSGTALWENVASTAITVGSAIVAGTSVYATNAGTSVYASTAGTSVYATNAGTSVSISGSITKSQVSDFTAGTVASASTAQQAGTAVYATTSGSASVAGSAVAYTGSITISQITDLANATVTSAATAQQAGTAVYALTSGTADYATTSGTSVYATTSGTAVTISGTITNSQVSDFASGTVANISGTVTQAQVSGLGSALAGKAGLADNNTFTGTNTFSNFTTFQAASDAIPIRIFGANGQSADLFSVNDYLTNTQFEILSDGRAQSLKGIIATVSGTASIPLVVRGTAGQSADLLQVQNSGGTAVGGFTSAAAFFVNNQTTVANSLNVQRQGTTHFRVDPFNNTFAVGTLTVGQNTTPGSIQLGVYSGGTATVPVVVRGASGQTANLQEWQNSGSTVIARVDKNGAVSANYFGPSATGLLGYLDWTTSSPLFQTGGTAVVGIRVRGAASQSASLQEWQNSAGAILTQIDSGGRILTSQNAGFGGRLTVGSQTVSGAARLVAVATSATDVPFVARGFASQSANLQEWQDSAGGTAARVNSTGSIITSQGFAVLGGASISGSIATLLQTSNAARIPLVVQGFTSQSADLQQWQTSTGSTALRVNSTGQLALNTTSNLAQLGVVPASTATVGVVVQGLSGQSADLQQWQTSTGSTAAYLGSGGAFRAAVLQTSSAAVDARLRNAGGEITFAKATAVSTNPGAGYGKIYFRDGTNAGTLKLVVIAGTAGAETTILDNIPT